MYNSYVSGNAETLSISSDDSIWDSDSDEEIPATVTPSTIGQPSSRLHYEHEEHSYCSTNEKSQVMTSLTRKRKRSGSSCTSSEEETGEEVYPKRVAFSHHKERFIRCIHHQPAFFRNGSMPIEGVKLSPWQQENHDELETSNSEEDDEDEEDELGLEESSQQSKFSGWKRKTLEDEEDEITRVTLPSDDAVELATISTPEKYKRAILKRYLSCTEDEKITCKRFKSERELLSTARPDEADEKGAEIQTIKTVTHSIGKRKHEEVESENGIQNSSEISKKPKTNGESHESARQNSELEAAEALTTLFRNHQGNRINLLSSKTNGRDPTKKQNIQN